MIKLAPGNGYYTKASDAPVIRPAQIYRSGPLVKLQPFPMLIWQRFNYNSTGQLSPHTLLLNRMIRLKLLATGQYGDHHARRI